jgi:hypothetical protein
MGGLVARRWLQPRASADVVGLLTIGTPHAGSRLARWGPGRAAQQMRPGSEWLRHLDLATDPGPRPEAAWLTCAWSAVDNFVAPADSARRPDARAVEFTGVGHFGMLRSAALLEVIQRVVAMAILPAPAPMPAAADAASGGG